MTGDIFETVKNNVKIADVVQDYGVQLNYQGQGLCPFHKEKRRRFRSSATTIFSNVSDAESRATQYRSWQR